MAATKSTVNKMLSLRRVLFWAAQQQGKCPHCKKDLVTSKLTSVDNVTFDHEGKYDHAKRKNIKGQPRGGQYIHKDCHRQMTCGKETKPWEYK